MESMEKSNEISRLIPSPSHFRTAPNWKMLTIEPRPSRCSQQAPTAAKSAEGACLNRLHTTQPTQPKVDPNPQWVIVTKPREKSGKSHVLWRVAMPASRDRLLSQKYDLEKRCRAQCLCSERHLGSTLCFSCSAFEYVSPWV